MELAKWRPLASNRRILTCVSSRETGAWKKRLSGRSLTLDVHSAYLRAVSFFNFADPNADVTTTMDTLPVLVLTHLGLMRRPLPKRFVDLQGLTGQSEECKDRF